VFDTWKLRIKEKETTIATKNKIKRKLAPIPYNKDC
jgi:hypothetical protein